MTEKKASCQPNFFQEPDSPKKPLRIYQVSEITQDIKLILESTFGEVWVEGEISNFKAYPSGHFYFTLKDEKAILPAVIFGAAYNKEIKFKFENGLSVVCFGRIEVYAPHGKYQLIAEKVEPKGIGSLQLALEQLKKRLEKEGLFAPGHKRPVPYLPKGIGIVTSSAGAAIRDILKVLETRFKDIHIIIKPVRVQGEGAKEDIAGAIQDLNKFNRELPDAEKIEVLIVGRGGGSIEDLWAFNEETVARAIYHSKIPVISAVGHERDWTIADLVADLRAATPSVAAQLVIPRQEDLRQKLKELNHDLRRAFLGAATNFQQGMDDLVSRLEVSTGHILELNNRHVGETIKRLMLLNPVLLIRQFKARTLDLARQIYVRMRHLWELRESRFLKAAEKLSGLSPLDILSRGYSITFKLPEGEIIKDALAVKSGEIIKTKLHKGEILSQVTKIVDS